MLSPRSPSDSAAASALCQRKDSINEIFCAMIGALCVS